MKTTFTYTVLRYVHDVATGEFVNMGVAVYAPEANYVSAICIPRYESLTKMFLEVNGEHLRKVMSYIQARFEEHAGKLKTEFTNAVGSQLKRIEGEESGKFFAAYLDEAKLELAANSGFPLVRDLSRMLTVDKYARIRQAHRDGMSIRAIARTFHHSRRKVREVLTNPEPKPYTRLGEPPAS